jgi:hypothetical protein
MLMPEFEGNAPGTSEQSAPSQPADLAAQQSLGGCVAPSTEQFVDARNLARFFIRRLASATTGRRVAVVSQVHLAASLCKNGAQRICA